MSPIGQSRIATLAGRKIEYLQAGSGGGPLIVLEAGLGDRWESWQPLLAQLAQRRRFIAYSRPGYGQSQWNGTPRKIATIADELRQLLHALGEKPPYVLVGHSLGGLIVQAYAARHVHEVAGLVLVDAPHPDQIEVLNRDDTDAGRNYRAFADALNGASRAEHEALTATGGGRWRSDTPCYGGPVIMLCGWLRPDTIPASYQQYRRRAALEAATTYPQAELRKVYAGHYLHQERPLAVMDAIDEVLARAAHPDVRCSL